MSRLTDDNSKFEQTAGELEYFARSARLTREDVAERLEKAVHDGKLDVGILGFFNARPLEALQGVPEDVCRAYNIPILGPTNTSQREKIAEKLEKAVQDGKLDARFLGSFITQPLNTLESIPDDVAEAYGIPRPAPQERPQWPGLNASWIEQAAYEREMRR